MGRMGALWAEMQERERSKGMARRTDPDTSHAAAQQTAPKLSKTQQQVYDMMLKHPPLTDLELHKLCCEAYGTRRESSYRKRRSEMAAKHLVQDTGERKFQEGANRIVWKLVN